jgi:hypothetical protein
MTNANQPNFHQLSHFASLSALQKAPELFQSQLKLFTAKLSVSLHAAFMPKLIKQIKLSYPLVAREIGKGEGKKH